MADRTRFASLTYKREVVLSADRMGESGFSPLGTGARVSGRVSSAIQPIPQGLALISPSIKRDAYIAD